MCRLTLISLLFFGIVGCASYPSGPREPQPGDDSYSIEEDELLTVPAEEGILINDIPGEGTKNILLTVGEVGSDAGGTFNFSGDGSFTYKPATDFNGKDELIYTVKNEKGKKSDALVTISVAPLPDPPKPVEDRREITEGQPVTIDALENDVEPDGQTMHIIDVTAPISGSAVLTADGQIVYTPDTDHSGEVKFSYTVVDSDGEEAAGWIYISISNVDNGIEAQPDTFSAVEDTPATIAASELLSNDRDLENNAPLTITRVGEAQNGTVRLNADATVTYTPTLNFFGADSFTYMVESQSGSTASALVTINVAAVADAPVISQIANQTTQEDTPISGIAFQVDDVETSAEELDVSATSSNRTLVPDANLIISGRGMDRTLSITPAPNRFGETVITVRVSDGDAANQTTFTLSVSPVNDPPVISNIEAQTTNEDVAAGPVSFTIGDPDRSAAEIHLIGISSNQSLVPDANIQFGGSGAQRTVTMTPAANQSGRANITIRVPDDDGSFIETTFLLTVIAVNDAPSITGIVADQTTPEDTPLVIPFTIGDVDTALANLSVTAVSSQPALVPNGNLVISGSGTARNLRITPLLNQSGRTTITINLSDGVSTTPFLINLVINPVNDLPTISSISDQQTSWSGPPALPVPVSVNFTISDVETPPGNLALSYAFSQTASGQTVSFGGTGANRTASVQPGAIPGDIIVSIIVTDAAGGRATRDFTVRVTLNISPLSTVSGGATVAKTAALLSTQTTVESGGDVTFQTEEDTSVSFSAENGLLASDTPLSGGVPKEVLSGTFTSFYGGEVYVGADGGFTYLPPANFFGEDRFTYRSYTVDNPAVMTYGQAFVKVRAVNDPPQAIDDLYSVEGGQTLRIGPTQGVLVNDRDAEDQVLSVIAQSYANLSIDSKGGLIYSPPAGFAGRRTFSYTVSDGSRTNTATLTLVVGGNKVPILQPDSYLVSGNGQISSSTANGLLVNDRDPDGQGLTLVHTGVFTTLFGGKVTLYPSGQFDYIAPPNFDGFDSFQYSVSDGKDQATGVADISVTP